MDEHVFDIKGRMYCPVANILCADGTIEEAIPKKESYFAKAFRNPKLAKKNRRYEGDIDEEVPF